MKATLAKGRRSWTVFRPDGLEIWRTDWRLFVRAAGSRRVHRQWRNDSDYSRRLDFDWAMHLEVES